MKKKDSIATLQSNVIGILSSNKWQSNFNFNYSNSLDLARDIAKSIYNNCAHCFVITEGIEPVKTRINEIIKENEKALLLYLKEPDRFIEGKIEAYKNCLMLIETYSGD